MRATVLSVQGRHPTNLNTTSPKPLSVLAFLTHSRVRFAGLRPPLTAPSTPLVGVAMPAQPHRSVVVRSTRNDIDPEFLRDFLAKQPNVRAIPTITFAYR